MRKGYFCSSRETGSGLWEYLEPRLLLDGVLDNWQPVRPLGSLVYEQRAAEQFNTPGQTDTFTLGLVAGQTLTVVAEPVDVALDVALSVRDPSSAELASVDANPAGGTE